MAEKKDEGSQATVQKKNEPAAEAKQAEPVQAKDQENNAKPVEVAQVAEAAKSE